MRRAPECQPRKKPVLPAFFRDNGTWYWVLAGEIRSEAGAMSRVGFSAVPAKNIGVALTLICVAFCAMPVPGMAHHARHHKVREVVDPKDAAFDQFVRGFRVTALAAGIAPATYDEA